MDNRPIGIMDSGVGGLTVARVLKEKYPKERFIFIGDTARNPYGNRNVSEITSFAQEMKAFLMERQVKMIIIACNTITFSVPPSYYESGIPVIGMSLDFSELQSVKSAAVIGTPATIRSHRHRTALKNHFPSMRIIEIPIDGLAHAIEIGEKAGSVSKIIESAFSGGEVKNIDAAVLACTHYPLISSVFRRLLPQALLVDPAEKTVEKAMAVLHEEQRQAKISGADTFFFTESTEQSKNLVKEIFGSQSEIQKVILSGA